MIRSPNSFTGARREEPVSGPVAGMALWLDAADASTLFTTAAGSTQSGADDPVGRWEDKSGDGYHATQSTDTDWRPTRKLSVQNSRDGVLFDGTDDFMSGLMTGKLSGNNPVTVFCAVNASSQGSTALARAAWGLGRNPGGNLDRRVALLAWESASASAIRLYGGFAVFSQLPLTASVITSLYSGGGGAWQVFQNGPEKTPSSSGTGNMNFQSGDYRIGKHSELDVSRDPFHGYVFEVLIYNTALSTGDRQANEAYLAAKWGITLS